MEATADIKQPETRPTAAPLEPLVRLPFSEVPIEQQNASFVDASGTLREVYVNLALAKLVSSFRFAESATKTRLMNPHSTPNAIAIENHLKAVFHCLGHRLENVVESLARYQETVLREVQANSSHNQ